MGKIITYAHDIATVFSGDAWKKYVYIQKLDGLGLLDDNSFNSSY